MVAKSTKVLPLFSFPRKTKFTKGVLPSFNKSNIHTPLLSPAICNKETFPQKDRARREREKSNYLETSFQHTHRDKGRLHLFASFFLASINAYTGLLSPLPPSFTENTFFFYIHPLSRLERAEFRRVFPFVLISPICQKGVLVRSYIPYFVQV